MSPVTPKRTFVRRMAINLVRWFDSWARDNEDEVEEDPKKIDWIRVVPFVVMHLACAAVLWVGWSWVAVAIAVGFYGLRMFAITAFYHRFFSHRAFSTSRPMQFCFALLGSTAVQRGPLWWAAHHRDHHRYSDQPGDAHSPVQDSFVWSHIGWILARINFRTKLENVKDLARFPELRFLDRFDTLVPLLLLPAFFALGEVMARLWPSLGTSGLQLVVWGFCISTVALYHGTFSINSLAHRFGSRRFKTKDESRNNFWLSLVTFGEGWHNNHHYFPGSVRQGFYWWEIDVSYYLLRVMSWLGLVWDLRPVPARVLARKDRG